MAGNLTEGQAKDLILNYCMKNKGGYISSDEIRKNLFPNSTRDIVNLLIDKIDNSYDSILDIKSNERSRYIRSNGVTKVFLEQGGYTQSEKEEKILAKKEEEKQRLEFEKTKVDLELAKKMLKEYPKTKWFARIGFFLAVTLAIFELMKFFIEINK